ncbi:MAG: dihydrofolate reductase [Pyrinomonadaceae bacterium]
MAGPLKNRLNIVMSRSHEVDAQESVIVLRDRVSVLSLQPYLACDLVIIGGEQIYRTFTPYIEKWMVTRVPLSVPDADTFMSPDFLDGFALSESRELEANLLVNFYQKL